MDVKTILDVVQIIVWVVLGGIAIYVQTNSKLKDKATELITMAEKEYASVTKSGGEKFNFVVDRLYAFVHTVLKPIITKEFISNIVEKAFVKVSEFSKTQLDKAVDDLIKGETVVVDDLSITGTVAGVVETEKVAE